MCISKCVYECVRNEKIKFQFTSITGSVKATDPDFDSDLDSNSTAMVSPRS